MKPLRILIIGAGLGGLAAAAGLQKLGHRVSVFEQASALGEVGAGIMLTPNAVRALDYIGALAEVRARAVEPEMSFSRHYQTGEILGERRVEGAYQAEYGTPMYNVHRADLHHALALVVSAGDPASIQLDHAFEGLAERPDGIETWFANGRRYQGDVVIGADGIRSVVRRVGLGVDSPPRFTNFVAWRGLAPLEDLPEALRGSSMTSWVSPDRHIIEYAVGELKNYVALALQPGWRSETWSTPSGIDEVLETFPAWHEDITTIIKATPAGGSYKFALFDHDPLPSWTRGRMTLLGDAAHPMLPLMAQGSAMAMEDAAILARAFEAADAPHEALARYEAARRERTAWTQLQSRAAREYYHSVDKGKWQAGTQERSRVLYSYDVNTVAV